MSLFFPIHSITARTRLLTAIVPKHLRPPAPTNCTYVWYRVAFHVPVNDFLEPFSDVNDCGGARAMAPNRSFSKTCLRQFRQAYHAAVAYMDHQVGGVRSSDLRDFWRPYLLRRAGVPPF